MKKEVGVMVQGGNWQLVTGRKPKDELPQDLEEFRKKKYWVPKYMMNFEIWGDESEIARQKEIIFSAVERYRKEGAKVAEWKLPPVAKEARLKKPNKIAIPYAQHEVGFLFITWYLPWKDTASCIRLWEEYMVKYGFTPVMWVASIEHGRECIGMPIVCFDWTDPESVKKVEEMDKEVTEISLDRGWINYRCNAGIHAPAHMKRAPEYYELLKKLKKFFDPNGIMHPGRLCL
jgi:FAD/FMN-containing dehydrogenase